MAQEINTFSAHAMRQIAEMVFAEKRQSLARSLASVRRHEGVIMPSSPVKIVIPQSTLYAAFGGGYGDYNANISYGNADFNALAISTGNYIPLSAGSTATGRNRKTYTADCTVMERDSSGILTTTTETLSCFNPGSLPIPAYTLCYAQKFDGDTWVITGVMNPHAANTRHFDISPSVTVAGDSYESKFSRSAHWAGRPSWTASNPLADWCHAIGKADIYIHHPGTYEVTYGVEVQRTSSDSADDHTWSVTGGGGGTLDLPEPRSVQCDLVQNWGAAAGTLAANWDTGDSLIKVVLPPRMAGSITAERTFMINHTLDTWHGQPYLRLSLAIGKCAASDPAGTVSLVGGWVSIRAAGSPVEGGNQGSGYNAFLGTDGAFQWYGGGTEPDDGDFGEDGT